MATHTIDLKRTAKAQWTGDLQHGEGYVSLGSGLLTAPYSFRSRMQDGAGTNPEELIGAAHAGCFTMALDAALGAAGFTPTSLTTTATVHFTQVPGGFSIPRIDLQVSGDVPAIDAARFQEIAQDAKANCPVSKALAGVEIALDATLVSGA
ncbi:MAG TPA: OsmC family peroxiredoxin [Candidatus Acidoferrales bacterium]|nr:OsmC family peroxiredoxin [Candidatus Acidoferrales bacterium]